MINNISDKPLFTIPSPKLVLLPEKKNINSFKKYEVVYGFNSSDGKYNHKKYIARVVTNDIEQFISESNTQYITVFQFYEVGKKRADFLCDRGFSFEFVNYRR